VCHEGREVHLRVVGRGTFQNAGLLKDASTLLFDQGARQFTLDLSECETMDSTFLGVLAGLAIRLRAAGGNAALTHVTGRKKELIENMSLDQLLTVLEDGGNGLSTEEHHAVTPPTGIARADSSTVLQAHETLSSLSDSNRRAFQDVVQYLRAELKKDRPPRPGATP
jgi:anti-anti-sigma factor